jgi:hypothetical protein
MFLIRNRARALFFAALLLGCTGCDVATTTLLPRAVDNRIVGEWRGPDEIGQSSTKTKLWQVRSSGDAYEFGTVEDFQKNDAAHFSLAKIGSLFLIQEVSDKPESYSACGKFTDSSPACRCLLGTVEIGQDRCVFRTFDPVALARDSFAGILQIPHQVHTERNNAGKLEAHILFSADAPALARFLEVYVPSHPASFKKPDTFVRAR